MEIMFLLLQLHCHEIWSKLALFHLLQFMVISLAVETSSAISFQFGPRNCFLFINLSSPSQSLKKARLVMNSMGDTKSTPANPQVYNYLYYNIDPKEGRKALE